MLGQSLCLAESPLQVNVSNTVLPAGGGIPAETTPALKLKLVLSPNKEVPLCETMDVISPSAYDMELDDGGGVLQIAEPASAPKKVSTVYTITVDILFKSLLLKFLKQIIRVFLLLIDKEGVLKGRQIQV